MPGAMDLDSEVSDAPVPERRVLSLRLLERIQSAQAQHGLRHQDYSRYRQYCTRRLRKLHKSTRFTHGRGKFVNRKLEPAIVTNERFLEIPLVSAERAWALANVIKGELTGQGDSRNRAHMLARFAKAARWSAELARLCAATADAATLLEAEAYAAWMAGLWRSERGDWELSLAKLARSRKLCEELLRVGDFGTQKACRQLLDVIEPGERYSEYQLQRTGKSPPAAEALAALGDEGGITMQELQSRVCQVVVAAPPSAAGAAVSAAAVTWRGREYPVKSSKIAAALVKAGEAGAAVPRALADGGGSGEGGDAGGQAAVLAAHDALLAAYAEALRCVQQEQQLGAGGGGATPEAATALDSLAVALRGLRIQHAMERQLVAATSLAGRWERTQQAALAGGKAKSKEKPVRAEEMVRCYDVLCGLAVELGELAGQAGGSDAEALLDESAAAGARYAAFRCFYVGVIHLASGAHEEAHALLDRAAALAEAAVDKVEEVVPRDAEAIAALQHLGERAAALRCAAHAERYAAELAGSEGGVAGRLGGLALEGEGGAGKGGGKFLMDNLDRWESFAGEDGRPPRLFQVPPPLQPIPARPIVLDAAQNYITLPKLAHRYQKRGPVEKSSTFARLFGWGSTKQ